MANRDFKIELDNVEMINGSDDLLKDTKVTKVTLTGENKLNSLNSTFENCTELTVIEGDVNLDGVSDMTEMTLNTPLDEIKVTNPTEENIQTDNSLNQVTNVKIGGTKYAKGGVQDVVGSLEWTAENFTYEDAILDNVYTNSSSIEDNKNITVSDTLEQKATSIEITGQTYENLVNGKATKNLLDEMSMQQTEGSPTQFAPHMEQPICLEYIEGQTYQNLVDGKGEKTLISEYSPVINDFVPNTFEPPQNQLICLESMEGETYQNLIKGKGEYKLTDSYSATCTDSNKGIDNPPSMIEIPEIWGNTVQDENDLNYIQSVGDLYVDENGEPILDEEGNEQYKLDIISHGYATEIINVNNQGVSRNIAQNIKIPKNTLYTLNTRYISPPTKMLFHIIAKIDFTQAQSGYFYTLTQGGSHGVKFNKSSSALILVYDNTEYILGSIKHNEPFMFTHRQTYDSDTKTYNLSYYLNGTLVLNIPDSSWGYQGNINLTFNSYFHTGYGGGCNGITVIYAQNATSYSNGCEEDWDKINQWNKTTILMPHQLKKFGRLKGYQPSTGDKWYDMYDKLYYDYNSKKFFIKNIPTIEHNILNVLTTMNPITPIYTRTYNDEDYYNIGIAFDANNKFEISGQGVIDDLTFMVKTAYPLPLLTGREYGLNWGTSNTTKLEGYCFGYVTQYSQGWTFNLSIKASNFGGRTLDKDGLIDFFTAYPTTVIVMKKQEQNGTYVGLENIYEIVETKILEKPSLETYSPKTYITTSAEVQPSQMSITNKEVKFIPLSLQPSKSYTIQLDSVGKDNKPITVNLGGATTTIQPTNDTSKHHRVSITTPNALTTDNLDLSGEGVVVNDVMLFEGNTSTIKQDIDYMDGIQSIGELIENKNLFDYTQSELGRLDITNGQISKDNSWKYTTEFIPVKPNTTYCVSQTSGSVFNYKIVEYNSSQSYLKGASLENSVGNNSRDYNTFTTSSTTSYIRLGWQVSIFEIQLEEDTFPTEFMAFDTVRYKLEIQTYDSAWDNI